MEYLSVIALQLSSDPHTWVFNPQLLAKIYSDTLVGTVCVCVCMCVCVLQEMF